MHSPVADPIISPRAPMLGTEHRAINGREPELSGARRLIVHVDDEPDVLLLIRMILELSGPYRVESFTKGQATLDFCRQHRPAALITDLRRPETDGPMLCHLIREDASLYDLPLMIYSAWLTAEDFALSVGAAFIGKPCDIDEFVTTLDDLIRSAGPRA